VELWSVESPDFKLADVEAVLLRYDALDVTPRQDISSEAKTRLA